MVHVFDTQNTMSTHFHSAVCQVFGTPLAGWAFMTMFVAELPQFRKVLQRQEAGQWQLTLTGLKHEWRIKRNQRVSKLQWLDDSSPSVIRVEPTCAVDQKILSSLTDREYRMVVSVQQKATPPNTVAIQTPQVTTLQTNMKARDMKVAQSAHANVEYKSEAGKWLCRYNGSVVTLIGQYSHGVFQRLRVGTKVCVILLIRF